MGFGFVVARFGLFLRELALAGTDQHLPSRGFSMPIGIGLIGFGIVVNFVSVIRHRRYIAAIDRNDFRSAFGSTFAIWWLYCLRALGWRWRSISYVCNRRAAGKANPLTNLAFT